MSVEILREKLGKGEAFLVVSPENRRYLTGFDSSDGFLFITSGKSVFLTDGRYIEAAQSKVKNCDEVELLEKATEQLPEVVKQEGISVIYTEEEKLSVAQFKRLCEILPCEVRAEKADCEIGAARRKKSEEEKRKIVDAQRIAERAFDHILTFIRPGVTEKEIRLALEYFMLRNGADGLSFETIAISGKNTSMPHGVPSEKKVESGEFVTMDYGALLDGYHSDMTRTVAVGSVTDEMAKVYDTVLKAQLACLDVLAPGVSCKDADGAARKVISDAGYGRYFNHGTGHGVGIDIHEKPTVNSRSSEILAPGDVVTDEPGIYIPGRFGVRIEDMVYITGSGKELLTNCEKSLIVL